MSNGNPWKQVNLETLENLDYEDLERIVANLPMTWYPALLTLMVEAAYDKKVFVPGGASTFITKTVEDKRKVKTP